MPDSVLNVWVDADACPNQIKDVIERAAHKRKVNAIFVANKAIKVLTSPYLSSVLVEVGPDVADDYIFEHAGPLDLVVTQDILLASRLVSNGVAAIDLRGVRFDESNIGERVSVRDLMSGLREIGEITGGPKQFGEKEKRAFSNTFDRELTKLIALASRNA